MKTIAGISFNFPSLPAEDYFSLDSTISLSDYDIVFFAPTMLNSGFYLSSNGDYEGKPLYSTSSSAKIIDQIKHWNNEVQIFLESGKTLILVLKEKEDFYVYSGSKTYSGTGKSRITTNLVQPQSNYDFLPFKINVTNARGKIIIPMHSLTKTFFESFKDYFKYEVYLAQSEAQSLFGTRNNDKVLGSYFKAYGGHVICLPNFDFEVDFLYTKEGDWNRQALQLSERFVQCITEIDRSIRFEQNKTPKPSWADNIEFQLIESQKTLDHILKNRKEIKRLEENNRQLTEKYDEQESLKDLLFETGKSLEDAVIKALKILGYSAENYDDGILELDQVIISPEKVRYIGECEGKDNKGIDVGKFRQLQDLLNEDFEREEVEEKAYGLLFGNSQRHIPPEERGQGFTLKCIQGAKREKIGLILTSDLFNVCKYLMQTDDNEYRTRCRQAIHDQLGGVIKFPMRE